MSYVEFGLRADEVQVLANYWRSVGRLPSPAPRAVLVVSAHWEAAVPTVMTSPHPPMLYDYGGFPSAAYTIEWPAPGHPVLAERVRALLATAGLPSASDPERGFDHGTFVPLGRCFPQADVPTIQLSLHKNLDPGEHIEIGRALAPLRDEGVYIIGSGLSFHNMRAFMDADDVDRHADRFDAWLQETIGLPKHERNARLTAWDQAPSARAAHPREEHLMPLMVVAGAAGADVGHIPFSGTLMGKRISAVQFGH